MLDDAGFDVSPAFVMGTNQIGGRLRQFTSPPRKTS
jgi:hypothetical protein